MRRFLFTVSISLLFFSAYSQNDKQEVEKLLDHFTETVASKPDSALYYIRQATVKCQKIDDPYLMSRCVFNHGYHYYLQSESVKAEKFFHQSLAWAKASKNNKIMAMSYNQLGLILTDRGNYNESLKNYLLAIDIADQNQLYKNKCAILINIGSVYEYQKDTVKALQCYLNAEKIAQKNDLKDILLSSYGSIAIIKRKTDIPLSLSYYNKAYLIAKALNDKYEEFNTLINLSYGYLSLNTKAGNVLAYSCLKKAEQIAIQLNNKEHLFYVYFNIGAYHYNLNEYAKALDCYKTAISFYEPKISIDQKSNLYKALIEVYKKTNDYQNAYLFQEKKNALKDSIFTIEKTKSFNEIQTKYEVEKKNLKIKLLSKEKQIERNRKRSAIYIGIILIIPMVLLLLFYKNRIKTQKLIRDKENKIFEQEKEQLKQDQELKRIIGVLEGQDQERNRVAKEIHDGVGGKLAGIKLHLSQINTDIKNEKIKEIIHAISNVFKELRAISHNLSQNYINEQPLESLLVELLEEYRGRNEFQIELHIFPEGGLDGLPQEIKHNIYRIIQELLTNVSKHAQAKSVLISFTKHEQFINLMVEDDGVGFYKKHKTGIGLKNIEERLQSIKGKMTIESAANQGSSLIINIPSPLFHD
ncbi:tetratricopeptide repeat protein [Flavobacterium sp.]|uniref:tetratricopeptide repeat-containing sensor histidine kinase n=1 Tax=Flavobacterium sp. TaxID=239 RepID=UPI00286C67FB|nr:tetratricopeptide repeat protein [Flavobacterium sp.]